MKAASSMAASWEMLRKSEAGLTHEDDARRGGGDEPAVPVGRNESAPPEYDVDRHSLNDKREAQRALTQHPV